MIRCLVAPNPSAMTLDGTRACIVGRERPVVIDPGPDDVVHAERVRTELMGARPVAILLTHGHADHAAGAARLAASTGAPVWMARGALLPAVPPERIGRWLRDGDEVETDAGTVTAIATPGHAPEHLCFLLRPAARGAVALFAGDLLMGKGDTTLVAPPEGDLGVYLGSLDRIARLAVDVVYPAHGPEIRDVPGTIARYRAHREARIRQVAAALREAPGAPAESLVDPVYGAALDPRLRDAARGSIEAVLAFLRASAA